MPFIENSEKEPFNPPTGQRRKIGISGGLVKADFSANWYTLIHATKHVSCGKNVVANIVSYIFGCIATFWRVFFIWGTKWCPSKIDSVPRDVSTKINNMAAPISRPHQPRPKRKYTQKSSFYLCECHGPFGIETSVFYRCFCRNTFYADVTQVYVTAYGSKQLGENRGGD